MYREFFFIVRVFFFIYGVYVFFYCVFFQISCTNHMFFLFLKLIYPILPQKGELGSCGENDRWITKDQSVNIIAVDPGHVVLIDAVRQHTNTIYVLLLIYYIYIYIYIYPCVEVGQQTRLLSEIAPTLHSLTNGHWHTMCGRYRLRQTNEHLTAKQPAIDHLAHYSAKVVGSAKYLLHVHARMSILETMKKRVVCPKPPRRWFFECYRQEQLAVHKLSKQLSS